MMQMPAAEWETILLTCGVAKPTAKKWAPIFGHEVREDTFSKDEADLVEFLPNILHESGMLERMEENLNYSSTRLVEVWPSRFPTVGSAIPYAYNPRALANKVYGGRMGNVAPDDGWTYRGRGPLQVTGRSNYALLSELVGQDLVGIPDLAAQPHYSLEICIAWWEDKIPDSMLGEVTSIRKRVNGGTLGLREVKAIREKLAGLLL